MYLFIATIFIAELIIALAIIRLIVNADKAVKKCNERVLNSFSGFEKIIKEFRICVSSFAQYYDCMIESMKRKRREMSAKLLKNVAMYLSLFLLKGKYKRVAAFLQFAVLFHDFWLKVQKN